MREVVIQSWCDECAAAGSDTPADPYDLMWHGREYSLDLCEDHAAPVQELQRLIETYGAPTPRKSKPTPKAAQVNIPGRTHRMKPETAAALQPDGTYKCSQCGQIFNTPQGLGAHKYRRQDHGAV